MIKVALIEFDYHAEVIRNSLHLLEQEELEVGVFTTEKIWKQVNWQGDDYFKTSLQSSEQSFSSYLKEHLPEINTYDIVLFNTVASQFKKWSEVALTPTTLLRIHNANTYFNSLIKTFKPKFSPFYLWKDSSHLVRKTLGEFDWHFRKKFVSSVDHFGFPSERIKEYALQEYELESSNAWSLPFGFWKELKTYPKNESQRFTITIIGKVDQRNRDYDTVVRSMSSLLPSLKENGQELDLVLLGSAGSNYGKSIVQELQNLTNEHFNVVSFDGFVPQDAFDQYIHKTDFFLIPAKIETRYTIHTERYGYTKISGSINDVIKYHKPAIIFGDYPIDEDMQSLFGTYRTASELTSKISEWTHSKSYQEIDFSQALASYRLDEMKAHYLNIFQQILAD
jgi:hypothetical protein